eukprot:8047118-Alexandrium_andersonii.AAC.1
MESAGRASEMVQQVISGWEQLRDLYEEGGLDSTLLFLGMAVLGFFGLRMFGARDEAVAARGRRDRARTATPDAADSEG